MTVCCCNSDQIETFIVIGVTALFTIFLWRSVLFAPLKLIAVFLHEFSHASANIMTGGKVSAIQVNEMYGGVTMSSGGSRCFTLWAGYIGSVVWGSFFVLMNFDPIATRVAASIFIIAAIATIIVLRIHRKKLWGCSCTLSLVLRIGIVLVIAITVGCWVIEELYSLDDASFPVHPLRWCVLAIGTICTLHALNDTVDDVVCHKVSNAEQGKSDAVMFAEEYGGMARCWGFIWATVAVVAAALALFGIIALESECPEETEQR